MSDEARRTQDETPRTQDGVGSRAVGSADARVVGRRVLLLGVPALGAWLVGCKDDEALTCTDISGLSVDEVQQRGATGYIDRAPKAELHCDRCTQYVEPAESGCGTCRVMPGPTHPKGYCKLFQPRS